MTTLLSTGFALLVKELFASQSIELLKDKLIENIDIKSAQILNKDIKNKNISKISNKFILFSILLLSGGFGYYYYKRVHKKSNKKDVSSKTYNIFGDIFNRFSKKNSARLN